MFELCQISQVDDEHRFMEYVQRHDRPLFGCGGWGRFYGEVPAIGTTLQIDWSDYELVNDVPFPESGEKDRERRSDFFRVIHHHRHLVPKPEYYSSKKSSTDRNHAMNVGHYSITLCVIYVVHERQR
jgi:hypothetical protein